MILFADLCCAWCLPCVVGIAGASGTGGVNLDMSDMYSSCEKVMLVKCEGTCPGKISATCSK